MTHRPILTLMFVLASALPARACWDTPNTTCFTDLWHSEAMGYHADDPTITRLYDLIDWGGVPGSAAAARSLLRDLTYDDLVAHHAPLPEVDPHYLVEIYRISLQAGDANRSNEWSQRLPEDLQSSPQLLNPDGTRKPPDPFARMQAHTIATLTHLRDGDTGAAATSASQATGEPAFLAWRAIARHAIAADDMILLTRATTGMTAALPPIKTLAFDRRAFDLALQAAEDEYARTGDPDAMSAVYESGNRAAQDLPVGAYITAALARRYLLHRTGRVGDDGFDTAVTAMTKALQNGWDDDDFTPMLNARTALRLGLTDEALQLIEMTFTHYPGVPGFSLFDLPEEPSPWADQWLDLMMARFDMLITDPTPYQTREYWDIWLDQDALSAAIAITQRLALDDRRDVVFAFAGRAMAYLGERPMPYPQQAPDNQAAVFVGETAAFLYPGEVAIPRMRAAGLTDDQIVDAFAQANRLNIALLVLEAQPGPRNMTYWMAYTPQVPDWQRDEYITALRPLIGEEAARLMADGHPEQAQVFNADAAAFWARQGDWPVAQGYYEQIKDVVGKYGPIPATRSRIKALQSIARGLNPAPAQIVYPYDDFAL